MTFFDTIGPIHFSFTVGLTEKNEQWLREGDLIILKNAVKSQTKKQNQQAEPTAHDSSKLTRSTTGNVNADSSDPPIQYKPVLGYVLEATKDNRKFGTLDPRIGKVNFFIL